MISFSPDFSNLTKFANLFSNAGGRSTQSFSKVDVQSQTQTGLSIVTAEGDKVTLSTNAAFQGTGVKYNARGVAEGQALSLRSNSLEGSFISEKQITIAGDLNEQEIEDIKKIVNQANGLRADVANGDLNTILANGQQIEATGTIASVDLKIKHSESVSVQQAFQRHKPEQPAFPSGTNTNESPKASNPTNSQLGFIDGILNGIGTKSRSNNEEENIGNPSLVESSGSGSSVTQKPETLLTQILEGIGKAAKGVGKSIETLSEKILEGAEKIASLAGKLNRVVENTTTRIEKDTKKISSLLSEGKFDEAEKLQQSTDRRINRLGKTTERMSDRIDRTADRLNGVVDSLNERLQEAGALTENSPSQDSPDQAEGSQTIEPQSEIKTTANV